MKKKTTHFIDIIEALFTILSPREEENMTTKKKRQKEEEKWLSASSLSIMKLVLVTLS